MKTMEVLDKVLKGKRMSESTKSNCREAFRSLALFSDEFPTKPVEVNEWLVSLAGYADSSIRLFFTIIRTASEYMEVNYDVKPNPFKGLKSPKVAKRKRRYFKANEVAMVIRACRTEFEVALVTALIDSGCRVGEIAGLKGGDVGEGFILVKGKTGERRYRLAGNLCEGLKRLAGSDGGYVFGGVPGNALSMRIIRICRRAGLRGKKLGAHTLRHSSGSLVAKETMNVMAVKALLQHDDIASSMIYVHDIDEELQQGISPLELVVRTMAGKQKALSEVVSGGRETAEVVDNLLLESYPEIGEGVAVRPLLRTDDLRLLRRVFIGYCQGGSAGADEGRTRDLLRRMLRKTRGLDK